MSYTSLVDKTVRCRKEHHCAWCGETIAKGEEAHYFSGVYEGEITSGHEHMECHDAIKRSGWLEDGYLFYEQKRGQTYDESHGL